MDQEQSPEVDVPNLGPLLNRTIWLLASIAGLFLGLRIYSKVSRKRSLWWDDHFLVTSFAALVVSTSLQSVCVALDLGKPNYAVNLATLNKMNMYAYMAGFFSLLALIWSKLSFALTLLCISSGWTKRFVWFIIITTNLVLGANATVQWVQCWPVERLWDNAAKGSCWPQQTVEHIGTMGTVYSGVVDIALAMLPWKIIWNVSINKKEKLGALFAMSMGVFAGITSFLKLTTIYAISDPNIASNVYLFIFGTAEGAITIIAASIPMLRPLFQSRSASPPLRGFAHNNYRHTKFEFDDDLKKGADEEVVIPVSR